MMSEAFFRMNQPWDVAIEWVVRQVSRAGLQVLRTFDLQLARLAHSECPCPLHGTQQCDCQMMVLLVYAEGYQPVSLVAHGHDGKTWLSLVDTAQQEADPRLEAAIMQAVRQGIGDRVIPASGGRGRGQDEKGEWDTDYTENGGLT
jgi:hypothetical protein